MSNGCKHGHLPPCTQCCDEQEISRLTARLADAENKQRIDQRQCDEMTATAGRLAEENTRLAERLAECERVKGIAAEDLANAREALHEALLGQKKAKAKLAEVEREMDAAVAEQAKMCIENPVSSGGKSHERMRAHIAEQERDAAIARAEKAEAERDQAASICDISEEMHGIIRSILRELVPQWRGAAFADDDVRGALLAVMAERDALRAEVEQYRVAIWSDDSTPAERGEQTAQDAARFVSGLRAEVERHKAAAHLVANACDCTHIAPVDSMRAAVAYVERLRGIEEAAKWYDEHPQDVMILFEQRRGFEMLHNILAGRWAFAPRKPAKEG